MALFHESKVHVPDISSEEYCNIQDTQSQESDAKQRPQDSQDFGTPKSSTQTQSQESEAWQEHMTHKILVKAKIIITEF